MCVCVCVCATQISYNFKYAYEPSALVQISVRSKFDPRCNQYVQPPEGPVLDATGCGNRGYPGLYSHVEVRVET